MSKQTVEYLPQIRQQQDQVIEEAKSILYQRLENHNPAMTSATKATDFLFLELAQEEREIFAVMFLDTCHRVIAFERLFYGTIDSASVHPREIAKAALKHNALAVILAHNHPSGNSEPSASDKNITERIVEGLNLLDIRTLDHLVIGSGQSLTVFLKTGFYRPVFSTNKTQQQKTLLMNGADTASAN